MAKEPLKYKQFTDKEFRPNSWDEYIGQKTIKQNLQLLLTAAKQRLQLPEHILFYGAPGLGKTTLAYLIAEETGREMRITSGPVIEKAGDLVSLLTNLNSGDILFIDEIHRLNKNLEEILYPAMESGQINIVLGKGPSARSIQLDLSPFTLIAATTRVAGLSSPLRSRFSGGIFKLEFYKDEDIEQIIKQSANKIEVKIPGEAIKEIALRSRSTPRLANYLLKRCRDYSQVHKRDLDRDSVQKALQILGIDDYGLSESDREYLRVLGEKFKGGPVGVKTLAVALHEEIDTIESVIEPYIIKIGFVERTQQGRKLTEDGKKYIVENFI